MVSEWLVCDGSVLEWVLLLVPELGGGPDLPYARLQQAKAAVQQVPFSYGGAGGL